MKLKMVKQEVYLRRQLVWQIIIPSVFAVTLLVTGYFIVHPAIKCLLIDDRKEASRSMVLGIYNMLQVYNNKVISGEITKTEAQETVLANIKLIRYGENNLNYYWIEDMDGNLIYHPTLESPEDVNPGITSSMKATALEVAQLVKKQNEGFLSYKWYPLKKKGPASEKNAFAKGFKPWGWIIGTGFMIQDIQTDLQHLSHNVLTTLIIFSICMLTVIFFILFRNYRNLQKIFHSDKELQKRESRFRGFVDHINNGLVIYENHEIVFVNKQFCNIFEIDQDNSLKFVLEDFVPAWEKERVKLITSTSKEKADLKFSTWLKLQNEKEKFVNIQILHDHSSLICFKYLLVEDQTEQKHTLTTIDILSENLTHSPESIVITDLEGNIEYVNPGFEKVTGYTLNDVKGKKPNILKSGKMQPVVYRDLWNSISSGQIWHGELLNSKRDGTLFWESTTIFPIKNRNNEIIKYSAIKSDISYNKRIEQELLAAKDKAEESNRLKTAFLNNISHEVRTPLNAVYGYAQILKLNPQLDKADDYLRLINKNCEILLNLFEDILDFSSIEARCIMLNKEDILLKDILLKLVSRYNSHITAVENKSVDIVCDWDENFETLVLHTDKKRINQIFDNLLSNAVKYTKQGEIKVSYDINFEYINFHISDTGVGIPVNEQKIIFDSFSHGENLFVSLHKGVGLGLNIAKLLVDMLGGKLVFESEEGKGSTFSFSLPTTDVKNYRINGNDIVSYKYNISDLTILVAEDNDENFRYMEAILTPANKLIRATTGVEAVQIIEKGEKLPDIILMDILMPVMDGISATRLIRNLNPNIPIIAVSAVSAEINCSDSLLFNDLLSKPINSLVLLQKINHLVKKIK